MKYDIIIPHYSVGETNALALKCLQSIRHYSKDYRLIWIDNGGTAACAELLEELHQHSHTVIIRNSENLRFVRAVNQGLAISNAPHIVIMNNDTEARPRWLEMLAAALHSSIGLSGPRSTSKLQWQGRVVPHQDPLILATGYMLAFFCVMMPRNVFEKVGYLDEDFSEGFGDDDHYCARIRKAGYKLSLVRNLQIPHHHRKTFQALFTPQEITEMHKKAATLYHQKVGTMK